MDSGAGNQSGCLLGHSPVEQLIRRTSDDECRAYNAPAVFGVVFEIRSEQLAVVAQDRSGVPEIGGQPVSILPKLEPHQPVVPGSAEQQRVFAYESSEVPSL